MNLNSLNKHLVFLNLLKQPLEKLCDSYKNENYYNLLTSTGVVNLKEKTKHSVCTALEPQVISQGCADVCVPVYKSQMYLVFFRSVSLNVEFNTKYYLLVPAIPYE